MNPSESQSRTVAHLKTKRWCISLVKPLESVAISKINLQEFNLAFNHLPLIWISGKIPESLGILSTIQVLVLKAKSLGSFGNLTNLKEFKLSRNLIVGRIPPLAALPNLIVSMVMAVVKKFFITSMFMWILPVAILYGFQHDLLPGINNLSPYTQTLLCGFLAVISVNIVIAFYIYMAMKEPSHKHEPDPTFVANAKASVSQSVQPEPKSGGKED